MSMFWRYPDYRGVYGNFGGMIEQGNHQKHLIPNSRISIRRNEQAPVFYVGHIDVFKDMHITDMQRKNILL